MELLLDLFAFPYPVHTVIICGSRTWSDPQPISTILTLLANLNRDLRVIEGGAKGADNIAFGLACSMGLNVESILADWKGKGSSAGTQRNRQMLRLDPQLVCAFKDDFDLTLSRGGTENMVKIALRAGVKVLRYSHQEGWREVVERGNEKAWAP